MAEKRILIISNNCLSEHNSNGRTMLNLVRDFPKDSISQIFTSGEISDDRFCAASLRITNRDAITSYFRSSSFSKAEWDDEIKTAHSLVKGKKTAPAMLLRDLVWDNSRRLQTEIIKWAKEQKPDCVILQIGDATLQMTIARKVAKELNIPLITVNTEDYYFKRYDYMKKTLSSGIVYGLFHHRFCKQFRKIMTLKPTCIYNCDGLKSLYDKAFSAKSQVIYCGTDFECIHTIPKDGMILYAGNLGVGRHESLIAIGDELQRIDKQLYIDVYGPATPDVKEKLDRAAGIRYHGVVSYQQVCEFVKNSRLLVHVESFGKYDALDTRYAFSTKLADYLASGIPIFLYGPTTGEGIHYINNYAAAFVVDNRETLRDEVKRALFDEKSRCTVSKNASELAKKNHCMRTNGLLFRELINAVAG